ncbi:MAG: tetraacyldisaccharide 4'-kinase [Campylobacterota bacterium]
MKQKFYTWVEEYLFYPNAFQKLISFLLLPLTFIYMFIIMTKRAMAKEIRLGIPIVSIGNIVVGGSGKTPITIALASKYNNPCVILRGYGRESKGLYVVSKSGVLLENNTSISGDEARVLANALPNATVIVSENRVKAIQKAKDLGCEVVFLDDGFSKYHIEKFNILLRPELEPTNIFCLPSGCYREPKSFYFYADMELKEGRDFKRVVTITKDLEATTLPTNTVLLTAISKPKRLLEYLPSNIEMISFPDHHNFTKSDIEKIENSYPNYGIVTTAKDFVKLQKFRLKNIYLMNLEIEFKNSIDFSIVDEYIKNYKRKSKNDK